MEAGAAGYSYVISWLRRRQSALSGADYSIARDKASNIINKYKYWSADYAGK